ncbi:HpcH/HpaI aldolase family protein [Halohasta salina]|uniref:HpcH/HpaI aldolase family protein n=1 Tax=Halohasta salina TaxID=2961621 RepID=UPI0020A3DC4E|nr:aldolase/citrate lyase family protein [Halohasta salina]
MRVENGLRQALEAGETLFGAACATFSPTVIETLGAVGFDFVWLDFEHGGPSPYDSTVFEELTRAAETGGIELLVRIPKPEPALVRKVLDAGVRTILIPRIETAAQLRPAVAAAHFAYDGGVGDRGVGVGRTSEWAGYVDSHIGGEDSHVLVGTMIENTQAVDNIEEICSVPQLGFAFIGPADLSMSMSDGEPLGKHPEQLQTAIDRTREACLEADVPVGRIHNDPADARQAVDDGVQLLRLGGDTGAIRSVLGDRLAAVDQ